MLNTRRIAKNTVMLYFRQILIMLVSLYTVRVVLNILGAEDYGIYNITAGVVSMFSFLSASMSTASQRYFSFELGRGDFEQLKKIFSVNITIYVLIAVLVLLLSETVGLWFVYNKLVIPPERKNAALWAYQTAIVGFIFTILTTPYMAVVIAHEAMNIYACISIVEAILKLVLAFLLQFISWDKLKLYGILLFLVVVINTSIYRLVCRVKFAECKTKLIWDAGLFKEIIAYTGWYMVHVVTHLFKTNAVRILLNQFFNPLAAAAHSIAYSITNTIGNFTGNFSIAIKPQIIKNYSSDNKNDMLSLIMRGAKGTYFLMYVFTLPLVSEMSIILKLWLKNYPEYTVLFTRLALIDVCITTITSPVQTAVIATGKMKLYQTVTGIILLLNFPLSWMLFQLGFPSYSLFIVGICLSVCFVAAQVIIAQKIVPIFSAKAFSKEVVAPVCFMSGISAIGPIILHNILSQGFFRLCLVVLTSVTSVCAIMYAICLNKTERTMIKQYLTNKILRRQT
jgi:O-antigen/teichoic acid export membrane protein